MKRGGGFSILELVLTLALVVLAFLAFMTIFSSSSRNSVQSRNRTVAIMLANSLMDEFEAHHYGDPPPQSWDKGKVSQPVEVWVEGRPQQMDFHKEVKFQNNSFVGSPGDQDLITLTISWREGAGIRQAGGVVPDDDKVLTVQMPVWR